MHLVMAGVTAPSHIYPGLAVIAELVSRGHRVSYLVGEQLAALVARTGAEAVTYESALPRADENWPDHAGAAMQLFLDESMTTLRSFGGVDAARTQPPLDVLAHADVFVTHAGMGGSAVSLWFGVPTSARAPSRRARLGWRRPCRRRGRAAQRSVRMKPSSGAASPAATAR
jgi:UDP:flavonoid glycosyltransferase YjiC (YdhE family)